MPDPIGTPPGEPAIPAPPSAPPPEAPIEPTSVLDMETSGLDREASQAALGKTREEAAKHRVEAREAKARVAELESRYEVFEQYDDNDRSTWVNLASEWANDPNVAATNFRTIANNVLGDPSATPAQVEAAEAVLEQTNTNTSDALTSESVAAMFDEKMTARDAATSRQAGIDAVHAEIGAAGFPKDTMENSSVLWLANNDPAAEGSVTKAIEIFKAKQTGVVTTYQESLAAQGRTPTIPAGGEGAQQVKEITSMEEANAGAKAFLAGRQRQ